MSPTYIDPVCGMVVDPAQTPENHVDHKGQTWWFCGKGCLLDFKDDPEVYLDPSYQPGGM
jgi:Cu+-exporting ATPase